MIALRFFAFLHAFCVTVTETARSGGEKRLAVLLTKRGTAYHL